MQRWIASYFTGLLAVASIARPLGAQISLGEYAARRAALAGRLDSGVIVAFGAVEPVSLWPSFFQSPAFYYLTGFSESNAVLVMVKQKSAVSATMFVPRRSPIEERYQGRRTGAAELKAKTGIVGTDISRLRPTIDSLAAGGLPFFIVPDAASSDHAAEDSLTRGTHFLSQVRLAHPWLVMHSLSDAVDRLRAKKSAAEIALLRRATEISARAHREAMKAVAPGCGEYEIQALLDGTFRRFGGDRPGYGSIVGSGSNATILHYVQDNRVMRDRELVLIDAATSFAHYSSDVTRTMPVNGKFSPAQREIYQIVRDAQEAFVRQIKPGVSFDFGRDSGKAVVAKGPALHGFGGHGIGLEVHDPAQYYQEIDDRWEVGDVFTVEPGLYVSPDLLGSLPDTPKNRAMLAKIRPAVQKYTGIGVRIEDDYALTDTGIEWLSAGVPREIAEIEALMRQREPELAGGGHCAHT
jgi:Xaa-Pro aminopeptidase